MPRVPCTALSRICPGTAAGAHLSSQRVASKSSSASILDDTSRAMTTAAASWSKPWMRSPRFWPSTHLDGVEAGGRGVKQQRGGKQREAAARWPAHGATCILPTDDAPPQRARTSA